MTQEFENYNQLRVFSRPLTGVYLLFFLMVTLMILVGATWMGLYLAKRITRPVQMLAHAAREIGAGHLDQRVEPQSDDEFGALTEAFNNMASELATSRAQGGADHARARTAAPVRRNDPRAHHHRRHLDQLVGHRHHHQQRGRASARCAAHRGRSAGRCSCSTARTSRRSRSLLGQRTRRRSSDAVEREVTIAREGHEAHLTVVATPLIGDGSAREGQILVLDDVTPLIRAQKVAAWREVARRLAHEIKNPLTPIQLSAERLKRHFADAPSGARALVDECTGTIVGEVESLKGLVDEFSQFARMPTPRTTPTDLHALIDSALSLYDGIFTDVDIREAVRR